MENEIDLEKKIKELDNIIYKVGQSTHIVHMLTKPQAFDDNIHKQALGYQNPFHLKKAQRIKPTLYDGVVISDKHVAMIVSDDEETLILEEVKLSADEAFWYHMLNPSTKSSVALPVKIEAPKELPKNNKEENVNHDKCELETTNEELENSVAKLLSENKRLCNEINHVKQVLKDQFDSIKKTRIRTKEQSDSLIDKLNLKYAKNEDLKAQIQDKVFVITSLKNDLRKLKGKESVDSAAQIPSATTIVPGMFKLDLAPLAPKLLQNREAHIDYLKHTQEQADILRGIVKQAKAKQPLDNALDFSCKHDQRIQELLVYVRDTCPNAIKHSAKKVESSNASDSNTHVLSSIGLKCSTSKCGSKPTCNKKNDKISQKPSRNMKNKVEAQPRNVNKMNRVVELICDVVVKKSLLNANSDLICPTC
ncbi:hypothetical protein Tco_1007754 [Tanacetum coccineum]